MIEEADNRQRSFEDSIIDEVWWRIVLLHLNVLKYVTL